jgi:SAM-dependent methyltransferase
VLDLGAHHGEMAKAALASGKVDRVICADPSLGMVEHITKDTPSLVIDYDNVNFREGSFDAITSAFSIHWVNDLPGMLMRMRRWLKPDGLLLLSMAGGVSFGGLRSCLAEAESQTAGGLSPRVLPMADIRDLGGLLGRAGFGLPVADSDTLSVSWADPLQMMRELRQMGESNALLGRANHITRRDTIMQAATLYQDRFSTDDQRVNADIELITLTAWSPSPDQQKPLKPGSADIHLGDFLNTNQDNGQN